MAFLEHWFKKLLPAMVICMAMAVPAHAQSFVVGRGLNLDQWVTWPAEKQWGDRKVMLPFPEWRKTLDAEGLKRLKAAGFDFVRMPVDPSPFLSDVSADLREELLASIAESAVLINQAGLKVIVDLHLILADNTRKIGMREVMDDPIMFDRYLGVVRDVGRAISQLDPAMVAFETMNEPVIGCEGDEQSVWEDRMMRLFAAARSSATRLTIVLSGGCWGGADGLSALDPKMVPDDKIIWSFHSHAPFLLSTQGATWAGDFIRYVTGLPYPFSRVSADELARIVDGIKNRIRKEAPLVQRDAHIAHLDRLLAEVDTAEKMEAVIERPFKLVDEWAQKHGIAPAQILLGEFGMIRQEHGQDFVIPPDWRAAFYHDVIDHAERHGFAWSMWSYGGAFGVVEEFELRPAEPAVLDMVRSLPARK